MKVNNDLLLQLSRCVKEGVQIESGDGELLVPGMLSLTTEVGLPINTAVISSSDLQRQSFMVSFVNRQAPLGLGFSSPICAYGKGLWKFDLIIWSFNGAVSAPSIANDNTLYLEDPTGLRTALFDHPHVDSISATFIRISTRLLFDRDGYILRPSIASWGAGDSSTMSIQGVFQKIT